jgi:long-chain fatty acid transport protein
MPLERSRLLLVLLAALAGAAAAQEEAPPVIEFSFSNPGARSMGFGGAFVALADDATAAFANPAGLVNLVEPEVSVEGRVWAYSTPLVEGGRGFGPATGRGLDVIPGLQVGESTVDLGGVSFLSLVYPKGDWSFAFYRHQAANFELAGETVALFFGPWPGFPDSRARSWDYRREMSFDITAYGLSAGYRVSDDLSLGLGVSYFDTDLSLRLESFAFAEEGEGWWGAQSFFAPDLLVRDWSLRTDDAAWGVLAGLLWRVSEQWSLGAVYRHGPAVEGAVEERAGPMHWAAPAGTVTEAGSGEFNLPSVFGLGAAFRSRDGRLTVGLEWDRVGYSSILRDADPDLVLEDGDELHLGAEYVFLRSKSVLAARLGAWLDPDHRIGYRGSGYVEQALILPGEDELHLAAGFGAVLKRVQIDLGVDVSDLVSTTSVSAIFSF